MLTSFGTKREKINNPTMRCPSLSLPHNYVKSILIQVIRNQYNVVIIASAYLGREIFFVSNVAAAKVGMMLRGMGFANTTPIYLASGKIYQADKNIAPLRKMFPHLHTKELLATPNELASLKGYSSRLAALDYMVCLFSEVFVTTQGGNFPHFLMGHRKFHYGHAKTVIPDKRKLVVLLHNTSTSWHAFKNEMQIMLAESDRKGVAIPRFKKTKRKNSIFANPLPQCRCLQESKISREE